MNEITLNKYLKRIILFLLLILSIFIILKISPFLNNFINNIFKIILPFIISFTIAYILEPIVLIIQKIIKKRFISVFITLLLFIGLIVLLIYTAIPIFIKEVEHLMNNYDSIIVSVEKAINEFANKLTFLPQEYRPTFNNLEEIFNDYINKIDISNIFNKMISSIGIIVIVPMTTIYLMLDYNKLIEKIKEYLINKNYIKLKKYLSELNMCIRSFLKTTFIIMFIVFIVSTIALFFAGSDYPLFFGLIIAITNIIPYLGPYIGGALPVLYALSESYTKAFVMVIIVVIIQIIESNIITPYLQGKKNEIHPIIVLFSLIISGKLFGIIGMIIAVPLIGVIKITYKYFPLKFKKSY